MRSAVSRWLPPLSIALRVRATATLTLSSAHLLAGTLHRRERRAHGVGTENCRPRGDGRAGRHAGSRWPNAPGVAALYSAGARHHKGLRSRAACPVGFLLGASGWTAPRRKGQRHATARLRDAWARAGGAFARMSMARAVGSCHSSPSSPSVDCSPHWEQEGVSRDFREGLSTRSGDTRECST